MAHHVAPARLSFPAALTCHHALCRRPVLERNRRGRRLGRAADVTGAGCILPGTPGEHRRHARRRSGSVSVRATILVRFRLVWI
jgi:hypothetical protein